MSRDIVPSESALSESPTPPIFIEGSGVLSDRPNSERRHARIADLGGI
jgi:hypothetical protein